MNQKLIREVRHALQYGNPWMSLGSVFAYTRLPVDKATVEAALQRMVDDQRAVTAERQGEVCYALPVAKVRTGQRHLSLEALYNAVAKAGAPVKIGDLCRDLDQTDHKVRILMLHLRRDGRVRSFSVRGERALLWEATGAQAPQPEQGGAQ